MSQPGPDDEMAALKARLALLEAQRPVAQPLPAPTGASGLKIGLGVGASIVLVLVALSVVGEMAPAGEHQVVYMVGGSAREASLTIQNATGGSEQMTVRLPWRQSMTVPGRAFVYVSAQNQDDRGGTLSCAIMVDGEVFKSSTSSGFAAIASCSGAAGVR